MAVSTGAAILGGAAISGVSSLISGKKASKAAGSAAGVQARAAEAGIEEQRRQFDLTRTDLQEAQEFARAQQQPFQEAGVGALGQQQALLGLSGQEAQQQAFQAFTESPGQRFLRERGEKALLRNTAAIGGLGGGNIRSALQEQGIGFAQQDFQNQFGRLGQLAGQGQSAASQVGQGALSTAGQIGQFGSQTAGNIANLGIAGSEARASGILGQQQARADTFGQIAGLAGTALGATATPPPPSTTFSNFSDRRLKKDIKLVGNDESGNIYEFRYKGNDILFIGRLAQELREIRPDAINMHKSGFLQVSNEFAPRVA